MKKTWIAVCLAAVMLLGCMQVFAASFNDVGEAHDWAKAAIETYADRGVLVGDGQGNFMPDNHVLRAEFAKMLCLVFRLDNAKELSYADVDKNSWQYDYIAKTDVYTYNAYQDRFEPYRLATRAEIAYAIVNAAGFEEKDVQLPFTDVNEANPTMLANIKTAYALGILKGYPDNTFRPNATVTRAEAVVLLSRAEAVLASQKPEEKPTEEPADEPKEEAERILIEPMETLCFVDDVAESLHPTKEELCLRLNIYVSGSETLRTLYVDKDVPIRDTDGTATTLKTGDVFCIDTNLYGAVKEIYIVLRMGDGALMAQPSVSETAFLEMLYVPTVHKWGYLEENKKHEVYLGFAGAVEFDADEAKISIYPSDGKKNSDAVRILSLSGDAKVLTYTTNAKKKNRYAWESVDSMTYYGATVDNFGNFMWESAEDTKYYQYVFVKTKNDEITDLVLISNQ